MLQIEEIIQGGIDRQPKLIENITRVFLWWF